MGFVLDECRAPSLQPAEDAIVRHGGGEGLDDFPTSYRGSCDEGGEDGVA